METIPKLFCIVYSANWYSLSRPKIFTVVRMAPPVANSGIASVGFQALFSEVTRMGVMITMTMTRPMIRQQHICLRFFF